MHTLQRARSQILQVCDASPHCAKETHYSLCCSLGCLTQQNSLCQSFKISWHVTMHILYVVSSDVPLCTICLYLCLERFI